MCLATSPTFHPGGASASIADFSTVPSIIEQQPKQLSFSRALYIKRAYWTSFFKPFDLVISFKSAYCEAINF